MEEEGEEEGGVFMMNPFGLDYLALSYVVVAMMPPPLSAYIHHHPPPCDMVSPTVIIALVVYKVRTARSKNLVGRLPEVALDSIYVSPSHGAGSQGVNQRAVQRGAPTSNNKVVAEEYIYARTGAEDRV